MNLDRTFCSGARCGKSNTCSRWTKNLEKWIEASGKKGAPIMVSIAQFADHKGDCDKYEWLDEQDEIVKVPEAITQKPDVSPA